MTLRFEGVRVPLTDFDLGVNATFHGPVTAIVGASGAGKTSLLELVAGLRPLAEGRVLFGDVPFEDAATAFRLPARDRGIGYLTQDDTLFPHLSVERNLLFGARGRERLDSIVEALDIGPLRRRSTRDLSGGERRRVALGRAVLAADRLLLADEPLTGLNTELRAAATELLARVKREAKTHILYVTHEPEDAEPLADEVFEVRRGRLARRDQP